MKSRFLSFFLNCALKYPVRVYWAIGLFTLITTALIPFITIDTDPENMLKADQTDRVFHNAVKKEFNLYDAIVVGVVNESDRKGIFNQESLSKVKRLTDFILTLDGVIPNDVMSLSTIDNVKAKTQTQSEAQVGDIRFEWMMKESPKSESEALAIKANAMRLPLVRDTLVSADGQATAIYVPIVSKDKSYPLSQSIQNFIDNEFEEKNTRIYMTGLPVAEDTFGFEMFVQMGISAPMAAAVIFVLMVLFFRSVILSIAPMVVAMATVLATMGLLIGCGFTVHIMSSMIAIFLMPIAVVDSVHVMSEFCDRYRTGDNVKEVLTEVIQHLFRPMLFTSITSSVGFFSLLLTPIPPVQIFGVFIGFGILLAFLWTLLFVPAYISRMSESELSAMQSKLHRSQTSGVLVRWLPSLGQLSIRHSKYWLSLFFIVIAISLYGIQSIKINDNPVRWFKEDHRIRVADDVLNHHFAGTYDAFLVFNTLENEQSNIELKTQIKQKTLALNNEKLVLMLEQYLQGKVELFEVFNLTETLLFDAKASEVEPLETLITLLESYADNVKTFTNPQELKYLADLSKALTETEMVGKVNGLTDLVKTIHRSLKGDNEAFYSIPASQNAVSQTILQFQSSHRPDDLWHMVNPSYSTTVLWLQLSSGDNQDMKRVITWLDEYVAEHPLPDGIGYRWAGKTYLNVVWQEAMVAGMLESLIGAFIAVFIMMIVLFRSFVFGILAMLPLTITITFIYGLIGWLGKDYDMPIAVLSALTLGLSIDFAIHFLQRTRELYAQTQSYSSTMTLMFQEPSRAIARNALVITFGFTPLLFAPLVPYITVGFFLASIMIVSALVTLILLPGIMGLLAKTIFGEK